MDEKPMILHLGLGAFHRAHQAAYLQNLHDLGDRGWRLVSGNIRPDMRSVEDALIRQGGRYTLETVSATGRRTHRTVESIEQVVPYAPGVAAMITLARESSTRIISMTVTEAGYFLTPGRELITGAADLAADLANGSSLTLYGALAAMLSARMRAGAGPVTLLSCDNLRSNGAQLSAGLTAFLAARGEGELLDWCGRNTTIPNAMVDRITPRPPPALTERVREATGFADACPVMAEDFRQWVIEDDFAAGRPPLERVGVEFVRDVTPYEEAKIRILNASHSAIAWAGVLKGYRYIHEGAADDAILAVARAYIAEGVIPSLTPSPIDLARYGRTTLERFANADLADTNERVAADSWAKLSGFIAPTLKARLAAGASLDAVAMPPALFLHFMQRWAAGLLPFEHQDQAMDAPAMRQMLASADPVAAFCGEPRLWGEMAGAERLRSAITRAYRQARADRRLIAAAAESVSAAATEAG